VRSRAGLLCLVVTLLACGDRTSSSEALPRSCEALTAMLDADMTAFRSSLDGACTTATQCTGVAYRAVRGDAVCLESDSCFLPVSVASGDALIGYLDMDPTFGAICLRMDEVGCRLPVPFCGPVAPVCEDGRCGLVALEPG
jgi:hypothetical protein